MKNLLHNILIGLILVLTMIGIPACSDDTPEQEHAEISFTATLPVDILSRSFGDAEQVNTLMVGVFNAQKEEVERKEFVIDGTRADVCIALAQNQTYHFIFWAYNKNQNIYHLEDLTSIEMKLPQSLTFSQAEASDAFFATKENVNVMGDRAYRIELCRPLAQINVGTIGKVGQASFKAKAVHNKFHPFSNTVSGEADLTWNFSETTTESFTVEGKTYNYLALAYLFAPTTRTEIAAELLLADISEPLAFPRVEIRANCRSNIAGKFTLETNN